MLRKGVRLLPKFRSLFHKRFPNDSRVITPMVSRDFYERGRDPFSQMENFMRDLERKFYREINQAFQLFPRGNVRWGPTDAVTKYSSSNLIGPFDASTSDKFKLEFNFKQAKEDNIKVTLKDRLLSVEAQIEEKSDNSSMSQSFSFDFNLPESIDVDSLQSILTKEGVLTIEASKTPDEAPKTINIKRE